VFLAPNTYNTKLAKAQQAQVINNFKNIKEKLLKTYAAIWSNKKYAKIIKQSPNT